MLSHYAFHNLETDNIEKIKMNNNHNCVDLITICWLETWAPSEYTFENNHCGVGFHTDKNTDKGRKEDISLRE